MTYMSKIHNPLNHKVSHFLCYRVMEEKKDRSKEKTNNKQKDGKDLSSVVSKIKKKELKRRSTIKILDFQLDGRSVKGIPPVSFEKKEMSGGSTGRGRSASVRKTHEQVGAKMKRVLADSSTTRVKEWRPKGKTIRKAHYDPHEVGGYCPDSLHSEKY